MIGRWTSMLHWNFVKKYNGVGWVVHDSLGSLICVGYQKIVQDWSIQFLKAQIILNVWHTYVTSSLCFSDIIFFFFWEVINLINNCSIDFSEVKNAVDEIVVLARQLESVHFSFCLRVCNHTTHYVGFLSHLDFLTIPIRKLLEDVRNFAFLVEVWMLWNMTFLFHLSKKTKSCLIVTMVFWG